ncbi:MAG: anaerobic ribonucleoside-triphosphate reductase activating protein [Oscillospiraceae bacterium]|nr:anaerobic ribonucleoside-triphosphate reductase activating protein [Oscillospiraceae bacterium]
MLILGLQKLSLLDFPGKLAATIFTGGCNLRCPYCHNARLVTRLESCTRIPENAVLGFLEKRRGLLDGICITGGEPLLQADIADFIIKVRALGLLVKLDTNGCFPERLERLIRRGLLDYVAMDIKNTLEKYPETVGLPAFDTAPVCRSIALLLKSAVPYAFRTTLVRPFHTEPDIAEMGRITAGAENYFLQNFEDSGELVGFGNTYANVPLSGFSPEKIACFRDILSHYAANVQIRN